MRQTNTSRLDASQPNLGNRPSSAQIVDAVVRFMRSYGLDRAEWGTDLICYSGGRKLTRSMVEQEGHYDMKCYWYELEIFLQQELGMFDPKRPRRFSKERPIR